MPETLNNEVEKKERAILSQVELFNTFSKDEQKKELARNGIRGEFLRSHPNLSLTVLVELVYIGIQDADYATLAQFAEALQEKKCTPPKT